MLYNCVKVGADAADQRVWGRVDQQIPIWEVIFTPLIFRMHIYRGLFINIGPMNLPTIIIIEA